MPITIREIREEDAAALLATQKAIDSETKFMLFEPGERRTTLSQVQKQIRRVLQDDNQILLVAGDDGEIAGWLSASGGWARRTRHRAYIVVGLRQGYTGQGIGTRLFEALESWARKRGLHRLELTVMSHNVRAVGLYTKMGFEIEGTKRDSLIVDGEYVDELYMAKILD